jgi:zinc protease
LRSAVDALRIRLREELREDQGGVYGVNVSGGISRWPKATFSSGVSFGCDPENVDKLIQLALDTIEELKSEGPDEELLNKVKETHLRSFEKSIKENGFWLSNLLYRTRHELPLEGILTFPSKPDTLTANDIKQALVRYFDPSNRIIARLLPEITDSE